jgi:opacity protein-like surface antigen
MNTNTLVVGLGILSLGCSAWAVDHSPSDYSGAENLSRKTSSLSSAQSTATNRNYNQNLSLSNSQTQTDKSFFSISLDGMYSFCNKQYNYLGNDLDVPDLYGVQLGFHFNKPSDEISGYHDIAFNIGVLGGSKTFDINQVKFKYSQTLVPVSCSYVFHKSLTNQANFYLGGKFGVVFCEEELSLRGSGWFWKQSEAKVRASLLLGFQFDVSEHTAIKFGYEWTRFNSKFSSYNVFSLGLNVSF